MAEMLTVPSLENTGLRIEIRMGEGYMRSAVPGRRAPSYSPRMAAARRLNVNGAAVSVQHALAHDSMLFPLQGTSARSGKFQDQAPGNAGHRFTNQQLREKPEENQNEEAIQCLVFCNSGIDAFNRSITGSCFPIQHRNVVASLKLDRWCPEPGIRLVCLSAGQSISIYWLKPRSRLPSLSLFSTDDFARRSKCIPFEHLSLYINNASETDGEHPKP